jgi:Protein NO VEIN, C-terminal
VPGDWSRPEVEATVADYREMLALELRGEPFNKAEHNRNLRRLLDDRSPGSVERKHQNISAILIELGYPYIDGYKPLGNYQDLLYRVVDEQVAGDAVLLALLKRSAEAPVTAPGDAEAVEDLLAALEDPPEPEERTPYLERERVRERTPAPPRLDYLALEASNSSRGQAGEEWVIRYERARLDRAGRANLADRIEWVSRDEGDFLGFDIRSYEADGTDRLVEVKTTKHGKQMPFYVTRNEVRVSRDRDRAYHLYRLFRFQRGTRLYVLPGALEKSCVLDPMGYEARVG